MGSNPTLSAIPFCAAPRFPAAGFIRGNFAARSLLLRLRSVGRRALPAVKCSSPP